MKLSIVVPCFNEEDIIDTFFLKLANVIINLNKFGLEVQLIFVDDGSTDQTLAKIKSFCTDEDKVRFISFSRNFGKESAIFAGLTHSDGDYVTLMDADLQDPPDLLISMYEKLIEENLDCVATRRKNRKGEPLFRSIFAKLFYTIINRMSDTEIVDGARDFRLMTRQFVDAVVSLNEYNRFSKGLFSWVGFETKWIEYENIDRKAGTTKWSFGALVKYSIDGIIAFSVAPLAAISIMGIIISAISFFAVILIVVNTLMLGNPVSGWPSLATIISFFGGVQLLSIGILGQYLSKAYTEVKGRQLYIIRDSNLGQGDKSGPSRKNLK